MLADRAADRQRVSAKLWLPGGIVTCVLLGELGAALLGTWAMLGFYAVGLATVYYLRRKGLLADPAPLRPEGNTSE